MMEFPAVEVKIPDSLVDPIAAIVCDRWNRAIMWRNEERVGGKSLHEVLSDCYDQRNGIPSPEDADVIERLGVDLRVNISELKSSALVAWLRDLLCNTAELPFTISPTPLPELSGETEKQILTEVKKEVFGNGYDGDMLSLVRGIKYKFREREQHAAQNAASRMYDLIKDQCVQGGFRGALLKMLNDFAVYPFAAMHGPVPTQVTRMAWDGGRLVAKNDIEFQFRPLSVFDVFWTPDSRDAQTGTAVLVRERMTKQDLYRCLNMPSYIRENVEKVIEQIVTGAASMSWLSRNPEQPVPFGGWGHGETVEVLRHYGLLSGRELMQYGVTGVNELDWYESTVSVVAGITIQVYISQNPAVNIRPVFMASFEQSGDRIPGVSICQKVRDVERAYLNTLRFMMTNIGFSSGPLGEVDFSRIQQYMTPEDVGRLAAMTMYPVSPDSYGGGRPAYYFHNIPNHANVLANVSQFFMDLADRITQIPAALHGEPVGTGANRTFRGMAMLYGNAIKPIQSAILNLDEHIFSPLGQLMYNYNMLYSDDESVKGDARVLAQGATGLIQKEVSKQTAMDTLQLIAAAGGAAQGMIDPAVVRWSVEAALRAAGVPVDDIASSTPSAPQVPQVPDAEQNDEENKI